VSQRSSLYPARRATSSEPRTISVKNGFATSGTINASVPVRCAESPRASRLGMYPSSAIDCSTRERVVELTLGLLLITRETVIGETPAWRATSLIVTEAALMLVLSVPQQAGNFAGHGLDYWLSSLLSVPQHPSKEGEPYA
jgi:hypothetical protein